MGKRNDGAQEGYNWGKSIKAGVTLGETKHCRFVLMVTLCIALGKSLATVSRKREMQAVCFLKAPIGSVNKKVELFSVEFSRENLHLNKLFRNVRICFI